jgi:hypothetical protein
VVEALNVSTGRWVTCDSKNAVCEGVENLCITLPGQSRARDGWFDWRSKTVQSKLPGFGWRLPSASKVCDRLDLHCRDKWRLPPQNEKPSVRQRRRGLGP